MCDEWMPPIRLTLTREQLRQLPRNAAYRYEWLDGQVHLRPRPRHYHALLDLRPLDGDESVPLRPVAVGDWEAASGKNLTTSSPLTATSTYSVRSDEYGGAAGEIFFGCRVPLNIPHFRLTSAERCCEVQSYLASRYQPIPA